MARFPIVGSDSGIWGTILNEFLNVEHNADGRLKSRLDVDLDWLKQVATSVLSSGSVDTSADNTVVSAAITAALASTTNVWNGYHVLYFPGGHTYTLGSMDRSGIQNLLCIGDGDASVIKRTSADTTSHIMKFESSTHVAFHNLAFDENNVDNFGGVKFYGSTDLRIQNCHFYDSLARGLGDTTTDRYAVVFGSSALVVQTDVYFGNNLIEDLQCEFDNTRRLTVEYNTSLRSPTTCAFGCFGINNSDCCEEATFRYNKIYDAFGNAFAFQKDTNPITNNSFKRIQVYGNYVKYITYSPRAIRLGQPSVSTADTTSVFEDIQFVGNHIEYDAGGPAPSAEVMFLVAPTDSAGYNYNRFRFSSNVIILNGKFGNFQVLDMRCLQNSRVEGNVIRGGVAGGMSMANRLLNNIIKFNTVETYGAAYTIQNTLGGNTLDDTNKYLGNPSTVLSQSGIGGGDSFTTPVTANGRSTPEVVHTFTSADATPSVIVGSKFITAGTTAITMFDDGRVGQTIKIRAAASITITNSSTLKLAAAANFDMTADDTLTLTMYVQGTWTEDNRSVN